MPFLRLIMLKGGLAECGYDWWHSFIGHDAETGAENGFFIELLTCNPELGGGEPVLWQLPENQANDRKPSYVMVKVGACGEDAAQLHRFFGWKKAEIAEGAPLHVKCGDCCLDEVSTRGHIRLTVEDMVAHPEYVWGANTASTGAKREPVDLFTAIVPRSMHTGK